MIKLLRSFLRSRRKKIFSHPVLLASGLLLLIAAEFLSWRIQKRYQLHNRSPGELLSAVHLVPCLVAEPVLGIVHLEGCRAKAIGFQPLSLDSRSLDSLFNKQLLSKRALWKKLRVQQRGVSGWKDVPGEGLVRASVEVAQEVRIGPYNLDAEHVLQLPGKRLPFVEGHARHVQLHDSSWTVGDDALLSSDSKTRVIFEACMLQGRVSLLASATRGADGLAWLGDLTQEPHFKAVHGSVAVDSLVGILSAEQMGWMFAMSLGTFCLNFIGVVLVFWPHEVYSCRDPTAAGSESFFAKSMNQSFLLSMSKTVVSHLLIRLCLNHSAQYSLTIIAATLGVCFVLDFLLPFEKCVDRQLEEEGEQLVAMDRVMGGDDNL